MTDIDMKDAIIGVELSEWVAIEEGIMKARKKAEEALLAANPIKKQAAIEETFKILDKLLMENR